MKTNGELWGHERHILLVDDTKSLAEMYALSLRQAGYQVTIAHSGEELFETLENDAFRPSILVLDVKLPDMDGLEILSRLKAMGFDAPVIVITGHGSINTAVEAMRLGASDFLVKPLPITALSESSAPRPSSSMRHGRGMGASAAAKKTRAMRSARSGRSNAAPSHCARDP